MRANDRKPPSSVIPPTASALRSKMVRGPQNNLQKVTLPPVDSLPKVSKKSTTARQMVMPELEGLDPLEDASNYIMKTMHKPGRSIPKLLAKDFGATRTYDHDSVGRFAKSKGNLKSKKPDLTAPVKKDMLAKFDEAIANPGLKATAKATRMKIQVQREIDNKVKSNPSVNAFQKEMDKMKNQFLGDVSAELGFRFDNSKDSFKDLDFPSQSSKKLNSFETIHTKLEDLARNWSTDAQKSSNKHWIAPEVTERNSQDSNLSHRTPVLNAANSKRPTAIPSGIVSSGKSSQMSISEAKLARISDGFRKSLQPIAKQDVRELIKTPTDNMMQEIEERHSKALNLLEDNHDKVHAMAVYPGKKVPSGNANLQKKSSPKVAPSQRKMDGLMNFRTLLEVQSGKPSTETKKKKKSTRQSTIDVPSVEELVREIPSLAQLQLSPQEINNQLRDSVKSMDEAAKIAQSLGTMMSRLAIHNTKHTTGELTQHAIRSNSKAIGKIRNPYEPFSEDVQKGASRLQNIAASAKNTWREHSVSCGIEMEKEDDIDSTTTGSTTGLNTEIQTDKEKPEELQEFEFVPDMSFVDQLMLKKLRGLQPTWKDEVTAEAQ